MSPGARARSSLLAALIRAQAWRAKSPIVFLRIIIIFFFFLYSSNFFPRVRGLLGPLTCLKSLENWHTPWNLWPLGPDRDWYTGVAQGLYSAPWNTEGHIPWILARIHMKLGTHVDLIKPNNFRTACHKLRPTGSWLFRVLWKTHALEFDILLWGTPPVCHKTRWTWSQDIGDAKLRRYFWYLERFVRGEALKLWREMRNRKCLITSTYTTWVWSNFIGLFDVWCRSHICDY